MHKHKTRANILDNECEKGTTSNQDMITVNKYILINDIANLLALGVLVGIMIGATIMQLIICLN